MSVPDSSNGDFIQTRDAGLQWQRQRYFYAGCAATERYLFALFSGNPQLQSGGGFEGRTIQVFDWSGHLVGLLALTVDLVSLASDEAGRTLFGASANGTTIYRFDIPAQFVGHDE
jgi:hypothetical protein